MDAHLENLIRRLEAASGPDRELDLAIAIEVWGRPGVLVAKQDFPGGPVREHTYWEYTGSFDAARTLIPEGLYWHAGEGKTRDDEPLGAAQIIEPGSLETIAEAEHASVIIALVIASLRARSAKGKGE